MRYHNKGFSLIELLIVLGIIGLLASVIVAGVWVARVRARNTERKQELAEIRKAIELYVSTHSVVPAFTGPGNCAVPEGCNSTQAQPWIPGLTSQYISVVSTDPINDAAFRYRYRPSSVARYELDAPIEGDDGSAESDGGNANTCPSDTTCRYETGFDLTALGDGP